MFTLARVRLNSSASSCVKYVFLPYVSVTPFRAVRILAGGPFRSGDVGGSPSFDQHSCSGLVSTPDQEKGEGTRYSTNTRVGSVSRAHSIDSKNISMEGICRMEQDIRCVR